MSTLKMNQTSQSQKKSKDVQGKEVRIFVHGLHPFTTTMDLITCFSPITQIFDIQFKKDVSTGKHKGYAFFSVKDKKTALDLIKRSHILHGRKIHCDLRYTDIHHQKKNQKKRIFVGGIPKSVDDDELTQLFEQFGEVRAAYSIKDLHGVSKCYGFVDFSEIKSAQNALKAKNLIIRGRVIDLRPFRKREEKKDRRKKNEEKLVEEFPVVGERQSRQNNPTIPVNHDFELDDFTSVFTEDLAQNCDLFTGFESPQDQSLMMNREFGNSGMNQNFSSNSFIPSTPQLQNQNAFYSIPVRPKANNSLSAFMNKTGEVIFEKNVMMNWLMMNNQFYDAVCIQQEIEFLKQKLSEECTISLNFNQKF